MINVIKDVTVSSVLNLGLFNKVREEVMGDVKVGDFINKQLLEFVGSIEYKRLDYRIGEGYLYFSPESVSDLVAGIVWRFRIEHIMTPVFLSEMSDELVAALANLEFKI